MMNTHERTRLVAVDESIVIDDVVGLAVLSGDTDRATLRWANPAFASLLGRQPDDLPGRRLVDLVDDRDLVTALAAPDRGRERTVRIATPAGSVVLQLSPIDRDEVLVVASPAHRSPRAAMYDAVTGLASLALFREHLQLGLHRRAREGDDLAIVTVGVPDFATSWQQHAGAASVLQARIAERIEQVVRDSDVLAARRPGSFVLLVVDPSDAVAAATLVSERMLAAFETPFALADHLQPLALNVGIGAVLPGDDVDVAIARADTALARAVSAGPATYRILLA
jgi:GGDEF domain-containing protein